MNLIYCDLINELASTKDGSTASSITERYQELFCASELLVAKTPEAIDPDGSYAPLVIMAVRSGGIEKQALDMITAIEKLQKSYYILLASAGQNSLASSLEIKAWMNNNNIPGKIYHESAAVQIKDVIYKLFWLFSLLQNVKLGILGGSAPWLISSKIERKSIQKNYGIEFIDLAWEEFISELKLRIEKLSENSKPEKSLIEIFSKLSRDHQISGFTINCFPLIEQFQVSSCLAISQLNSRDFSIGCEGDPQALLTMTIARMLNDSPVFMGNISDLEPDDGRILISHCACALELLGNFELTSHFESNKSIAVSGSWRSQPQNLTLLRFGGNKCQKLFYAPVQLLTSENRPNHCRTQILLQSTPETVAQLLDNPLGNHHILVPGDISKELKILSEIVHFVFDD